MPDKKQSILMGGLVVALLNTSYLSFINVLCCLGVILGCVVAVWHYTDTNEITLRGGQGAVIGLMAALVGFVIATILNLILIKLGVRHDLAVGQFIYNKFGSNMPPEQADQMLAEMEKPFSLGTYFLNSAKGFPFFIGFGALGGLIGAKMFKKGGDEPTSDTLGHSEMAEGDGDSF